ncbi:conserved hypothetical protein [Theileria orientalis strain Shintoku]|uniref:Uncharacterized protein n=1 Tax=Theileria orientalis strain Shintoku TaxID=869250 RepID=J4CCY1_THEOR|nr:conserved hypothetical protein [Theileria orientalis strain Shintoku]BAM40182.1 conserved hypothetical protein [Theileria orientalis strain Shintoku]|eukprot:XP_009690483.1 conserved hypothetical protein [Theileria orientalis strain Shintoku]
MAVYDVLNAPLLEEDSSSYGNSSSFGSSSLSHNENILLPVEGTYDSMFDGNTASTRNGVDNTSICKSYFYGQLANVTKSAVWWSMIGVLVNNFTSSYYGLAVTRCAFNVALILGSFVANLIAEVVNIRKLLCVTTMCRLVIWSVFIPLFYSASQTYSMERPFWVLFVILMVVDGFQVSLSNTVDLDYEGVDRISHQYDIIVPDSLHQHMNNVYQMVFDFSFIFVSVPLGLLIMLLDRNTDLGDQFILIGVFDLVFFLLSMVSLTFYVFGMPVIKSSQYLAYARNLSLSLFSVLSEFFSKLKDNRDGFKIMLMKPHLMRKLLYFSFETAYENSIYLLIIPQLAYNNKWFPNMGTSGVNLFCVCLISLSKLGTSIYGIYITNKIKNDSSDNLYRSKPGTIIKCLLFSSFAVLLLPVSLMFEDLPYFKWLSLTLLSVSLFLFFMFTTLPKITYSSILQYNISNHPLSYKLFDFVGTFITLVDAFVIFGLSFLLRFPGGEITTEKILIYTSVSYVVYAIVQIVMGEFRIY